MLQAAEEAQSGSGGELQQVEEQLEALDAELAKQGGTQAPASKQNHIHATAVTACQEAVCARIWCRHLFG